MSANRTCVQRSVDANLCHQQGLRRTRETPPPADQKFPPGTRVRIADNLGPSMSHFPSGKNATVEYTYAHAYGAGGNHARRYSLNIDGVGSVSWYSEHQLTPITCGVDDFL